MLSGISRTWSSSSNPLQDNAFQKSLGANFILKMNKRGIRFKAKDLERGRKYLWRKEFVPLLYKYLDISPRQVVVDVGSGTGFLTRLLARPVGGNGRVIGVEKNGRLVSVAKRINEQEGLTQVSFKEGRAEMLPLGDNFADRVVCQTLLWIPRDPRKTLQEMIRVCKPGGIVGSIEGGFDYITWYVPDDPRLTELYRKSITAESTGYHKVYGSDRGIGYKLAPIFIESGLKRVRVDAYAYVWTESDDRVPRNFKLREHREYVARYRKPMDAQRKEYTRLLLAGGMRKAEIEEARRLTYGRSKRITDNPALLDQDFSLHSGIFYITTGVKPPEG